MHEWEHYINKTTRDLRAAEIKLNGGLNVKKRSSRGQVISPSYIEDWSTSGRSASPNGFGGLADTYVAVLYTVEWEVR